MTRNVNDTNFPKKSRGKENLTKNVSFPQKNLKKIEQKLSIFDTKTLRKLKKNSSFLEKNLEKIEEKMLVFYRKT